ncbi:MAG TPA: hypothetical protein VI299_14600 [Polyangiales bacterium]
MVPPQGALQRLRWGGLLVLLLLVVGATEQAIAQANTEQRAPAELVSELAPSSQGGSGAELAQWRVVLHDEPSWEEPGLESEADGDPAAPDTAGSVCSELACTAPAAPSGQLLRAAPVTYRARFATSPVLARAPPRCAR